MNWIEALQQKVLAHEAQVGQGASLESIEAAEEAIGPFPSEYREFLSRFGYASVGPHEIYGLGSDLPQYLNVEFMTLTERRDADGFPSNGIVIFNDGGGNLHFLESNRDADRYPVKVWYQEDPSDIETVSEGFPAWLLSRLMKGSV
jgi:hypothetical protein